MDTITRRSRSHQSGIPAGGGGNPHSPARGPADATRPRGHAGGPARARPGTRAGEWAWAGAERRARRQGAQAELGDLEDAPAGQRADADARAPLARWRARAAGATNSPPASTSSGPASTARNTAITCPGPGIVTTRRGGWRVGLPAARHRRRLARLGHGHLGRAADRAGCSDAEFQRRLASAAGLTPLPGNWWAPAARAGRLGPPPSRASSRRRHVRIAAAASSASRTAS
jgi:hypothetical protein